MSARRKQEDQHLKILKSIQQQDCNKRCFECDQRGPTYVDVTIGSFVCTSCGGILRGINPPHRVKSVSMATFSPAEISLMQSHGNEWCKNVYMGKYDDRSKAKPESRGDLGKLRSFMEEKYERKRWYVAPEQIDKTPNKKSVVTTSETPPPVKPLGSVLKNPPPIRTQPSKSYEPEPLAATKPAVENMLGDFTSFDSLPNPVNSGSTTSQNSTGFADFGNAFTTPTFDAFGDFTSGSESSSNQNQATSATFAATFPATSEPAPPVKPVDKYAALGDLFSLDPPTAAVPESSSAASSTMWGSVFMTSVTGGSTSTPGSSVFDAPPSNNSVFGGLQVSSAASLQSSHSGFQHNASDKSTSSASDMFSNQNAFNSTAAFSNFQTNSVTYANTNQLGQDQQQQSFANLRQSGASGHQTSPFGQPAQQNLFANSMQPGNFVQPTQNTFASQQQLQPNNMQAQMTTQNSSNPFFPQQQPPQPSNPFLAMQAQQSAQQQGGWGQNQSQTMTNPFMTQQQHQQHHSLATQPPRLSSTNPFF